MNTLTVSIVLLVVATLIAVAVHSIWQGLRAGRTALQRGNARERQPAVETTASQPSSRERAEPSLGVDDDRSSSAAVSSMTFPTADSSFLSNEAQAPAGTFPGSVSTETGVVAESRPPVEAPGREGSPIHEVDLEEGRLVRETALTAADPAAFERSATGRADMEQLSVEPVANGESAAESAAGQPHGVASHSESQPLSVVDAAAAAAAPAKASAATFTSTSTSTSSARRASKEPALDPRVDCIVEYALDKPLAGPRLVQAIQSIRRFGSKPVLFEGVLANEATVAAAPGRASTAAAVNEPLDGGQLANLAQSEAWQRVRPESAYRSVRLGVLMANRHGALNPMEFSEFAETARRLAEFWGALAVVPDMARTLEHARSLDVECIKLDAQLGLNIDAHDSLTPSNLTRIARDQTLTERGNTRFVRLSQQDEVLFSVALGDRPNRLTLLLDVPRAPVEEQPWPALLRCAHEIMTAVQGHLVDDSGRPLNSRNLDSLSAELAQRYAMLDQSGFKAGSALALRVFN